MQIYAILPRNANDSEEKSKIQLPNFTLDQSIEEMLAALDAMSPEKFAGQQKNFHSERKDELEIPIKAALDGEYVEKQSFLFDCKCFFGTIKSVLKHDGVVEGGTGSMSKEKADVA